MSAGRHASSCVITNRPAQPKSKNSNNLNSIEREALRNEFNAGVIFKQDADIDDDEIM